MEAERIQVNLRLPEEIVVRADILRTRARVHRNVLFLAALELLAAAVDIGRVPPDLMKRLAERNPRVAEVVTKLVAVLALTAASKNNTIMFVGA